ncbi:hypothetical protein CZ794_07650 [Psychrobacter sp. JB385]|nr:hypothetical protein CZ794_07650 [Psychrobacter sp. JB385]
MQWLNDSRFVFSSALSLSPDDLEWVDSCAWFNTLLGEEHVLSCLLLIGQQLLLF